MALRPAIQPALISEGEQNQTMGVETRLALQADLPVIEAVALRARWTTASSPFAITPPSSSTQVDDRDHADACDGGERSSSSGLRASPRPSSCAPSSRQPPSAGDR